jgi:predicted DNA-binding transcriptional regulator AlpA
MFNNNNHIPEYVSMTQMAELLNLSRSRFYQLVEDDFFLKPLRLSSNKRPVYSREMALENISFRKNNFGANKKIVMFYSTRSPSVVTNPVITVCKLAHVVCINVVSNAVNHQLR